MKSRSRLFIYAVMALVVVQVLTVLLSWIVSAVWPSLAVESLLGNSGLRWLLSSYADNVSSPILSWMLLLSVAYGMFRYNGFPQSLTSKNEDNPKVLFARKIFYLEIFLGILFCLILAFYPHSFVLGVSGHLFPGPFLTIVLFVMIMVTIFANISFMYLSEKATDDKSTEKALIFGLQSVAPLIVIYLLLKEWAEMVLFVLQKYF